MTYASHININVLLLSHKKFPLSSFFIEGIHSKNQSSLMCVLASH
jgi:hypothetical protein